MNTSLKLVAGITLATGLLPALMPAAFAQAPAAPSAVTIYGLIDTGVEFIDKVERDQRGLAARVLSPGRRASSIRQGDLGTRT